LLNDRLLLGWQTVHLVNGLTKDQCQGVVEALVEIAVCQREGLALLDCKDQQLAEALTISRSIAIGANCLPCLGDLQGLIAAWIRIQAVLDDGLIELNRFLVGQQPCLKEGLILG
jgi:hypothetical protein